MLKHNAMFPIFQSFTPLRFLHREYSVPISSVVSRGSSYALLLIWSDREPPRMRTRRRVFRRAKKKQRARMRSVGFLHVYVRAMMHVHINENRTRRVNKQTNKPHSTSRGLFREFCSSHIHFWDWLLRQLSECARSIPELPLSPLPEGGKRFRLSEM